MTSLVDVTVGPFSFAARLEEERAPRTCAAFRAMLPWDTRMIHVRWSGEGVWVPMGDNHVDLPWENHSCYPVPGQFIFYPGGVSEAEILLSYGNVCFSSKFGQLPGNQFLTIVEGTEQLEELGRMILWEGAQPTQFRLRAA